MRVSAGCAAAGREASPVRIVEQHPDTNYVLTPLGLDAYQALRPLLRWSTRWAEQLDVDEVMGA